MIHEQLRDSYLTYQSSQDGSWVKSIETPKNPNKNIIRKRVAPADSLFGNMLLGIASPTERRGENTTLPAAREWKARLDASNARNESNNRIRGLAADENNALRMSSEGKPQK